jgi:hypothetical protein
MTVQRQTKLTPWPSLRALWGLLWRSIVFLPFTLFLTIVWFSIWTAVYALPLVAVFLLVEAQWVYAVVAIVSWSLLFILSRWKKLHVDSKDTLNGNENI